MDMKPAARRLVLSFLLAAGGAGAETAQVSPSGFVVTHRAETQAAPEQAFAAIGHPERWWNKEHTFSGEASNLSLGLRAGDCFCERWDAGSVEHARVIYVARNSTVRLQGALGPLQGLAVSTVMTFGLRKAEGKTIVQLTYRVSGSADAELDKLAGPVDQVLGDQLKRLVAYADGGTP